MSVVLARKVATTNTLCAFQMIAGQARGWEPTLEESQFRTLPFTSHLMGTSINLFHLPTVVAIGKGRSKSGV